jgi:hypothetical protein
MLMVQTSMPSPSFDASSLNLRVSVSHTAVSSEGTELSMITFPLASLSLTGWSEVLIAVKSGASSPCLISLPPKVIGLPLKVTAALLCADIFFSSPGVIAIQPRLAALGRTNIVAARLENSKPKKIGYRIQDSVKRKDFNYSLKPE